MECFKCAKVFTTRAALNRHQRNVCGDKSKNPCTICSKVFTSEEYLKRHVTSAHIKPLGKEGSDPRILEKMGKMVKFRKTYCKCQEEGCLDINFPNLNAFRRHLIDFHGKAMTKSTYTFASLEEFHYWKETTEIKIGISYHSYHGGKTQSSNAKRIFYCRRSGTYKPSSGTRKRSLKTQGSCRIGHYCTSTIELSINNGMYYVTFYEEHYGHTLDQESLAHAPLPKSTKNFVAGNLALRIPKKDILEKIRSTEGRTSLITQDDLRNIENSIKQHERRTIEKNIKLHKLEYLHENDVHKTQKHEIYNDLNRIREIVSSQNLSLEHLETIKKQLNGVESTINVALLEMPDSSNSLNNTNPGNQHFESPPLKKSNKAKRKSISVAMKPPSENEKAILSLYLDQGKNYEIEEDDSLLNGSNYPFEQGHVEIVIN